LSPGIAVGLSTPRVRLIVGASEAKPTLVRDESCRLDRAAAGERLAGGADDEHERCCERDGG